MGAIFTPGDSVFRLVPPQKFAEWIPGGPMEAFDSPILDMPFLASFVAVGPMTRGFPSAKATIHEWIPGVSTPEGLILGSMAAAMLISLVEPHTFERVVTGATTFLVVGVTTALPAGAVWFGSSLFLK